MKKIFIILFLIFTSMSKIDAQTGIGTTTPVNKFEVVATAADPASSNSSANGNLRLGNSTAAHVLDFGLSSSSTYAWLQARSKSNYATNYNLVINPNGGLVGIGKSSPASALDVNGTITANAFSGTWSGSVVTVPYGGTGVSSTSANFIFAGPSGSTGAPSFRALVAADIPLQEATDEFTATTGQTLFTLNNQKSSRSVFKLYINGVRISNTAYSISGVNFTYIPANNGSYSLTAGDRVQIDYYY
jgi:hypothetical protein